jgi:hypothetical protein
MQDMVFVGTSTLMIAAVVAAALIVPRREAAAWSVYSRQTGLRCDQCHTRSGKLTALGEKVQGERR